MLELKLLGTGLAIGTAFVVGAHWWNDHRMPRMSYKESSAIKREMVARIGGRMSDYELDHIVPLCMGGSNDRANLQLQLWADAKRKDADEARLCRAIDHGYPIEKARQEMRDWRP